MRAWFWIQGWQLVAVIAAGWIAGFVMGVALR